MTADLARRLRSWLQALATRTPGALTGIWWEQAAVTAEDPARVVWDRRRDDGTWHLPWGAVHTTPCPGEPWTTRPDRWAGPLRCGAGHWHTRAHLGLKELP